MIFFAVIVFCYLVNLEQLAMALIRFLIPQLSSGMYYLILSVLALLQSEFKRTIQGFTFVWTLFAYINIFRAQ